MANDYYLEIEGIKGESKDEKHKDQIDVHSYSFGVHNAGSFSAGGGGGTGRSTFQDIQLTKGVDKASPKLMLACATGQHITKATLYVRKAGKEQQEFYKVVMSDVLVSSWSDGGHGEDNESFSLNFAKVEMEYKEQQKDGTLGGAVKASYDLKTHKGS
jgi:type VI secretion system secreted protein Hcp